MEMSSFITIMFSPKEFTPFLKPLADLQKLIKKSNCRGIVIGGIAASLLAVPRLTADIDMMIISSIEEIGLILENAMQEGFVPRINNVLDFACKNRVILLRHEESGINIDISLGVLPFEIEAIERSTECKLKNITIQLPSPEDFIILKAVAHRPKDLIDIKSIVELHPVLDKKRIEYWVKQFAELLEMPEIWTDIVNLL